MYVVEENKLSIIMPVYNVAEFVEKAIRSVLQQTYKNIELVLVDDGSTDGSEMICHQLSKLDSRIRLIRKMNQGVSAARNDGLFAATGDYITFADSDDWVETDAYEKMMDYLRNSHADICVMGYTTEGDKSFASQLYKEKKQLLSRNEAVAKLIEGKIYTWSIGDKIYRKKLLEEIYFHKEIYNGEDFLFNWQAFRKSNMIAYIPLHGYHYMQRMNSMTNSFSEKKLTVIKVFLKILNDCANEPLLQEKINVKYMTTLLWLFVNYLREDNYSCWKYEFIELRKAQTFLRDNWKGILWMHLAMKYKIAALFIMLPPIFMKMIVKIKFR